MFMGLENEGNKKETYEKIIIGQRWILGCLQVAQCFNTEGKITEKNNNKLISYNT